MQYQPAEHIPVELARPVVAQYSPVYNNNGLIRLYYDQ